jgi:hypothetical protein
MRAGRMQRIRPVAPRGKLPVKGSMSATDAANEMGFIDACRKRDLTEANEEG